MNYMELFRLAAEKYADRPALIDLDGERTTTYAELDRLSGQVAGKLHALGVRPGSFVTVNMDRRMEYMAAYLGVLKAGCAVVPLVPDYPRERVSYIAAHCAAAAQITADFFDDVGACAPFCEPADGAQPALLIYTSGSTGVPKGIVHSTADLARIVQRQTFFFRLDCPLRFAAAGAFSFAIHVLEYLTVFFCGGCAVLLSDEVRRSVRLTEDAYERFEITYGYIPPQMLRIFRNRAPSLRRVITGSERVSQIYSPDFDIINIYGMSETLLVTAFFIDRPYPNTPLGQALENAELRVCSDDGLPVPDGTEGEIYICVPSDVRYFKDDARTAATMLRQSDGTTAVRTGDIGCVASDGNLYFVNRRDWMVKINGQRVETLEVETLLMQLPQIRNAAVKAFTDEDAQTYLVGFYEAEQALDDGAIREALRKKLPEYMVPRFLQYMPQLPRSRNGKLDRKSLCAPDARLFKNDYLAPETPIEEALCAAFEAVLYCGQVGAGDDFFALGGDSIKVLRLIEAAGLDALTPDRVLLGKTPRAIAALLTQQADAPIAHRSEPPRLCPLSEAQKGVYLECVSAPDSVMYNIPMLCRLPEGADPERFVRAVKAAAAAHPALRTTVCTPDGVPSMLLHDGPIVVEEKTVSSLDALCRSFVRPFDLENGPLYRFCLCRYPGGAAFLFDVHHLVFDGTSAQALLAQIADIYRGAPAAPEALTVFDVALAEPLIRNSEAYRAAQRYFRERLEGVDFDSRPVPDQIGSPAPTGAGSLSVRTENYFTRREVESFVKAHGVTENTLFLGAFAYTLARFNGSDECAFCTASSGRRDPRLQQSVGMFVKTLPVYCAVSPSQSVTQFLSALQNDLFLSIRHDCISFGELAAQYGAGTGVVFVYQSELFSGAALECGQLDAQLLDTGETQSDLDVMLLKSAGGYSVLAHYRKPLYTQALIRSFCAAYLRVLSQMLRVQTLGQIVLSGPEDERQLARFNRTEQSYDASVTVVDEFRAQAKKTPDAVCVACGETRLTYRQADELTDRLAALLVKNGVGREKIVGVLIPRCENMMLCSMGVLKSGGAYMPLDPGYPAERLGLMLRDSGAAALLYAPEYAGLIPDDFAGLRLSTELLSQLPPCESALPRPAPEDLFVLLYTSGSTGTPKGVMFAHSNTLVTAVWVRNYYGLDENARVAAYASYGFDAHVFDMYSAITSGAQLHIIAEELRLDFPALRRYFDENGITHAVMTTQIGRQFAQMAPFRTLRHLSVAGEKLAPLDVPSGLRLYNLYGPTEGSVVTSAFRLERRYSDVPIGRAVDNLKAYVVDGEGRLLPVGAVGELWISGPHVTRGYLNRPEKTAEVFRDNPFCDKPDYRRVYRTGDIVRYLHDGNLQFVGRRDAQVKIRGFRVELTEVEQIIRRFPGVKDVTVAPFDDPAGGKYLAAYVVSDEPVSQDALCAFIRAEKPPYMAPAVVMQLASIPLTQNQKVNRRALPAPQRSFADVTPPENDVQKKIFGLIAEVVGHENFGIHTDLYEAGLTSIGSVRLNVLLAEAFDVPVRIADIKANSTVQRLEAFVLSAAPKKQYALQPDYPVTQTQNGIFVESMAASGTTVYNVPLLLHLNRSVDAQALSRAVCAALDAHPYVKTLLFTAPDGSVRARRRDDAPVSVPVVRCGALPTQAELVRPFVLLGQPLYRAAVYQTESETALFLDFHHMIFDGASESILLRDIDRAYAGLPLHAERYSGYEAALEEEQSSEAHTRSLQYWQSLLSGCDGACLPKKAPESAAGGTGSLLLTGSVPARRVTDFCRSAGLSVNAFLNGAFSLVLSRLLGKDSFCYATIHNGRSDSRLADCVTMAVQTIPVRVELNREEPVAEHLKKMQTQLLDSMANSACSFAELSASFGVNADLLFIYQGELFRFDSLCGSPARMHVFPPESAKAPLSVNVSLKDGHFLYSFEYRRELYSADFARCLTDTLESAMQGLLQSRLLRDVSLLSEKAERVYAALNDSGVPTRPIPAHRLFEERARQTPDAPAVTCSGQSLRYGELNEKANRVAHALLRLGVQGGDIVGLVLERGCAVPLCELGILKSGGAFLPMLPGYPDERIDFCLKNAESPFVITTEALKKEKSALFSDDRPYRTLCLESLLCEPDCGDPAVPVAPEQLAYCIYTSGSTGVPKGVMIEHHSFSNFLQTDPLPLRFFSEPDEPGTALAISSISFDMSLYEQHMALACGRCVCIATEDEIHDPLALRERMLRERVTFLCCTPSFMNNLVSIDAFAPAIRQLRTLVLGAEAFPPALYGALRALNPKLQILNGYGPTEATICCSCKELLSGDNVTIGRPTGNMKMYVVDRAGQVLPPYAPGELILCGEGVGRGYVRLPEKTAASFFRLRGLPAYHSGDLVRLTADGEIDFTGRLDNQVKLRGFRVELDEIEKAVCAYDGVKQCRVVVRNNGSEDFLAGFFTAEKPVSLDSLTAFLKSRLTDYMVPAALMQLSEMPLTANGKIDAKALPEIRRAERKTAKKAPKQSLEQRICEIFRTVLSAQEIYADDNFFELGGTSLSASKVTMVLMSEGIEVKYGDIFANPTPEALAAFIESRGVHAAAQEAPAVKSEPKTREALRYNLVRYAHEVTLHPLGNVLLTGAVGFLGIHVLRELLTQTDGHIYCLVRRGSHESPLLRLKTMLFYYFSSSFEQELQQRITVLEADITDDRLGSILSDVPFDTVINCAACVKHFSDSDILERINVHGVENLIAVCKEKNARLVQISTTSVPGIHTPQSYEKQIRMHENELFVIDDMDNKYAISKYHAELLMLDAIESGLRGKIIRVGNLMGRHSDGEFQVNLETNMFLSGIRGFAVMGKYPISHMTDPMRFSPIDCTAKAVVLLAGTNDKFTAFHCDNRYGFDEMKIIDACNRNGISIVPTDDEAYYAEFNRKLGDERVNSRLNGLAAYDIKDAHAVDTDNLFTTNILYRIGFSWPLVDDTYLDRAIHSIMTLDYFDLDGMIDSEP